MVPTLYILMRSDMESLNPGKAMAQAAHAANAFVTRMGEKVLFDREMFEGFGQWERETSQGFGTTIVLDALGEVTLEKVVTEAMFSGFPAGLVHDPSYPVKDGYVTHTIPVNTCGYVFTYCRESYPLEVLNGLNLHR